MKQDFSLSKFLTVQTERAPKAAPYTKHRCEVIAIAPGKDADASYQLHKDYKDYRPLLDRLTKAAELSAKTGAACLVRLAGIRGGEHVLFIGTGIDRDGVNQLGAIERLRRLGAQVAHKLAAEKIDDAAVHLDTFLGPASKIALDAASAAYAFSEGAGLACYRFEKYITKKADKKNEVLALALASGDANRLKGFQRGIEQARAMVTGASLCRDLSNEPSNDLYPADFAERAKKLGASHGLKVTVLDEKSIEKEKMGLLYGVGQGSVRPPRLIVMEYNPPQKSKSSGKVKTIAFVGKGITFDSGGISIKPSARMEDMKHDMSGAAAVVGAIVSAAELKVPARIITIVAAAENMPGGKAICPGNILTARSGKTVEITNTDAEGRLVLADALDYVQDMKPDYIIDLATLTGAAGITLGKSCSGLMGNDAGFNRLVATAAKESGERIWELPLFDEYFDDLKSEYADMRNSGDGPSHGTAKGAMFLLQYIRKGTRWVHLDIASVANGVSFVPYYPKKASTGYGVRLLVELAKKL